MTETIRRELTLGAPPSRLWRALTDSTEIARWMYPNDFQAAVGHRFTLQVPVSPQADYGPSDGLVRCEVVECVPEKTLSYTWSAGEVVGTKVRHELEATDGGTRLSVEQTGFDLSQRWGEPAFRGAEYGWSLMLDRLAELVAKPT
jgi:uncharacterized protein YndB with AHSA1/START domain